jgi:hypothetical protein
VTPFWHGRDAAGPKRPPAKLTGTEDRPRDIALAGNLINLIRISAKPRPAPVRESIHEPGLSFGKRQGFVIEVRGRTGLWL